MTPDDAQQTTHPVNVAARLTITASRMPDSVGVVEPLGYDREGRRRYRQVTFAELEEDSNRIARGLIQQGLAPGTRLALLVKPGIDFISLVFGLYKAGAVAILIDPGMGPRNMIRCLTEVRPQGFVAIPPAHAVRVILRHRFPDSRLNVTVGRRWFWGGPTLSQLRATVSGDPLEIRTKGDDLAAIIFTTGSTGPPKGVAYSHGNFDAQVDQIRDQYHIQPGEIDLPGFPLFGLFNCAMGVTTVIPDMDPSRPATVDPRKILEATRDWNVTQSFGSPAIWNRVGRYCVEHGETLPTLRRVLSAGAPVPAHVLQRMKSCIHPEGEIHTPYGATEALPVATNSASVVLGETEARTREGAGVCVGHRFSGIQWKIIQVVDGPLEQFTDVEELPQGEIGELIVQGPVVTRRYVTRIQANATGKIVDGSNIWHRMGDVGYLDDQDRFWFCGRMAHRLLTEHGPMYTIPCEAVFNQHEAVYRSALVGVGPPGAQRPVLIAEPLPEYWPRSDQDRGRLVSELGDLAGRNDLTRPIHDFLLHQSFPVDIRHNAKIFREKLAVWAESQLSEGEHRHA